MELRKQYTKEFKLDAISLLLDQGFTIAEAARSLEIRANMLGRWIKENQADNYGQAFRGNGKLTQEQEEIRRLKIENKQLKLERQILKEAAVFFAKETKYVARCRVSEAQAHGSHTPSPLSPVLCRCPAHPVNRPGF
jgi:transposase